MRKIIVAGGILTAVALVAGVVVALAPPAVAQQGRYTPFLITEGLGSSIGVAVRDSDADEARKAGTNGVVVQEVREGTPAARAGVRTGDLIVDFDGERARSASQLTRVVRETAPGRAVKMTIFRDASRQTLDITPEARGADSIASNIVANVRTAPGVDGRNFAFDYLTTFDNPFSRQRLGVTVTQLSDQLAAYFGVKQGVLVSEVTSGSPAETAGVKAGDIITTINSRAVSTADDVVRELRAVAPGSGVEVRVMRDRKPLTLTAKLPEPTRPPAVFSGRTI
jgi:serine protease Do